MATPEKATHTPAPWTVEKDDPAYVVMAGQVVGKVGPYNASYAEHAANARLISVAPELLALGKMILKRLDAEYDERMAKGEEHPQFIFSGARAEIATLIAKAEGVGA